MRNAGTRGEMSGQFGRFGHSAGTPESAEGMGEGFVRVDHG